LLEIQIGCDTEEAVSLLYRMNNASKGTTNQNVLVSPEAEKVKQVFETFSRITWQSFVATRITLLKKPQEVLEEIRKGNIHYTKAILIAGVKNPEQRQKLLTEAIQKKLSLAEIKNRIKTTSEVVKTEPTISLQKRLTKVLQQVKKNKTLWKDPQRSEEVETLLLKLETLVDSSSTL
jgi:ParB family transcriptional regulator, chromosome partitioning protein